MSESISRTIRGSSMDRIRSSNMNRIRSSIGTESGTLSRTVSRATSEGGGGVVVKLMGS